MNLIVEKTRKNDVFNIHGYGNNNKQACRPSDRLTGFLLRRMSWFMAPLRHSGASDMSPQCGP